MKLRFYYLLLLTGVILVIIFAYVFMKKDTTVSPSLQPLTPVSNIQTSPLSVHNTPTPTPTPNTSWTLILTGDIIPARVVNQRMVEKQDFSWPIREIESVLKDADITFADLEAPLLTQCRITNEGFQFCGDAQFAKPLAAAGIDIVNLANNHTLNYGWEGIEETEKLLRQYDVSYTGFTTQEDLFPDDGIVCRRTATCSAVTIKKVQGVTVGFLGYNAVGQQLGESIVKQQIERVKSRVDLLVVAVHWGKEYERMPVPDRSMAPDDPKKWGKNFIDWGADIVAGNHPHWYQPVEWYQGKPIFYAMGNTIFDQEWSTETKRGFLAKIIIRNQKTSPENVTYFPIGIRDYGQAYLLEGKEKEDVLTFLNSK